METRKIAMACFIGGFICSAVAVAVNPMFWWIGLIAGFASGYLAYEFREVRKAIPVALCAAGRRSASAFAKARMWLSKRHPFFYPAAVVVTPLFVWLAYHIVPYVMQDLMERPLPVRIILMSIFYAEMVMGFVFPAWLVLVPLFILAFIGARAGERCYWWPFLMPSSETQTEKEVKRLEEKGLQRKPMTYSNVLRWAAKGFGLTVMFFTWTLWKYLMIGVWKMLCFFGRFAWHLFKLIHSNKRLLCAIDGTIGGAIAYIYLVSPSMTIQEKALLCIFGGVIGAVVGVANYEFMSKGLLRLPVNSS